MMDGKKHALFTAFDFSWSGYTKGKEKVLDYAAFEPEGKRLTIILLQGWYVMFGWLID